MAGWSKPGVGFLKLNVNGVFNMANMGADVGCVIRDPMGMWKKGSAGFIGLATPVAAELWAMFYGLKLAWEMDVGNNPRKVIVECDSMEAVDDVLNPQPNFPFALLMDMIQALLHEAWAVLQLDVIEEGANAAANTLATHNLASSGGIEELHAAPSFLQAVLDNEA